jgi:hypothetical protein
LLGLAELALGIHGRFAGPVHILVEGVVDFAWGFNAGVRQVVLERPHPRRDVVGRRDEALHPVCGVLRPLEVRLRSEVGRLQHVLERFRLLCLLEQFLVTVANLLQVVLSLSQESARLANAAESAFGDVVQHLTVQVVVVWSGCR